MRFTKKMILTSAAIFATAGMVGGSVLAANAGEERTAGPPSAAASVTTATPLPDASPNADALNDPLTDAGIPVEPDTSVPQTMSSSGDCVGKLGHSPTVRSMAVRAACYWKKQGLPQKRVKKFIGQGVAWVGGGRFWNKEGKLPTQANHWYLEFDMNAQPLGQRRDASRVVIDMASGFWYYTSDHYNTFTKFDVPIIHDET